MQYVVAALLAVYFLFFLEHTFSAEFMHKVSDFTQRDWLSISFVPILLIASAFVARRYKKDRLNSREIFWVSIIFATLALPLILPYTNSESGIAVVVSAYLASIGWLYTNHNNIKNQRKAHTMSVLIQLRNSAEYQKHRLNIFSKFPLGTPVKDGDLEQLKKEHANQASFSNGATSTMDSMVYVLNYFEFISIGVKTEDLDGAMIELSLRGIFVNWYNHLLPVIRDAPNRGSPRTHINFRELVEQKFKTRFVD
ncbi:MULTISPECIES: DUF4760 domain-containing protein [unclassified Bradyrhizobium]|uniref:DUF4760 domain-containing protein n=1 Tax=unclassified Bradyrhizobium TaxID=2631580 RepID=UPI0013E1C813|nr:DUF4760 domain-containing protein [Bradyrhizobium sp. 6(2017)]QIG92145.1 DUF4760 domain-containing protein [Bradyrhizobium sp. 6(2017)]